MVVRRDGRLIEVQLRTPSQHRWALNVEAIDLASRLGLKEGKGPESLQKLLEMSAYAMEATSKGETMSEEFDRKFERPETGRQPQSEVEEVRQWQLFTFCSCTTSSCSA